MFRESADTSCEGVGISMRLRRQDQTPDGLGICIFTYETIVIMIVKGTLEASLPRLRNTGCNGRNMALIRSVTKIQAD